jgi:hypothetical protein
MNADGKQDCPQAGNDQSGERFIHACDLLAASRSF